MVSSDSTLSARLFVDPAGDSAREVAEDPFDLVANNGWTALPCPAAKTEGTLRATFSGEMERDGPCMISMQSSSSKDVSSTIAESASFRLSILRRFAMDGLEVVGWSGESGM